MTKLNLPKSGRTKEEEDRRKAQQQNAAAKKKKSQQKNTAKKKQNAKKDDRKTESVKTLGLRLPSVWDNALPTLSKEDQKTAVEQMRSRMNKAEKRTAEKPNYRKNTNDKRYNPLIRSATPLVRDSSPEINNLAEATVRKGAQGFEGALVGYSDRRNMKRAEDILTGEYNNRFVPGVKGGLRMQVDDPMQLRRAEAEAKKAGFNSVEDWEIAKANELIRANNDFYRRKEALDADVEAQGYTGIKKHIPDVAEQIGSMIPTMAVGAASGGIGAAAGLTGGAAWALNTVLTGGEIGGRVSGSESRQVYNALLQQNNARAAWALGRELSIDDYRDAIQKANTAGELVGIAEAGTEALFGGLPFVGKGLMNVAAAKVGWEVLSPATRQSIQAWRNTTTGRIFTQVAERTGGAIGEGVEEAIMTRAQPAIESSVAGLESDVTLNDILHDFGMGAAVSLVLGIPVTAVETTSTAVDGVRSRDAKNEMMTLFENRFKEMVSAGQLTPEEAKTKVQEVNDILSGRGSLNVNDVQSETKTDSDTKEVYTDLTKAKEALESKAKGREVGEEVSVAVVENGVAETWKATVTENGIEKMQLGTTTEEEQQAYLNKAQKMETATNEAERTGYQLNVKEDIINEVSALSKAFGKDIEFVATDGAVHGYVDDDGKISVNINSSESPARAVIA
ncbi:MAG: hypothetical protein IJF43_06535, partial [Firmicutes bacterium]|nr:hypothetical protein [Bacillota bacterium]